MAGVFQAPHPFDEWTERAERLLHHQELERLEGEQALEHLALSLRHIWLRVAYEHSSSYMMSPPQGQYKCLPDGERITYPYDRWIKPKLLEQRLNAQRPAPEGWTARAVLFANGMAAITSVLQVYHASAETIFPGSKGPLSLHWFGGYFEITRALQLICDDHLHGRKHADQRDLCSSVERGVADLVLIEPVAADIDLHVFDLGAFINAWKNRRSDRPCAIVVDTSLCGPTFPMERLCREIKHRPPAFVAQVRSGLKLDQEGLEFSNAGLLTLWTPNDPESIERLDQFEDTLRLARTTVGAGLSQNECAALNVPFFLDQASFVRHAARVFENNRHLARALAHVVKSDVGLFSHVTHPCLGAAKDEPWAEAPYVNVRYRADDKSARDFLYAVLKYESRSRKLCFQAGSSFGFRAHRFEMGFARGVKYNSLRIAIGSRSGPSLDGVIELFQELAAYPDFTAVRRAYPQLEANETDGRDESGT